MSQLISTPPSDSQFNSYNEKQQLRSPPFYRHQPSLPPTPSSSALSFLVMDQNSIDDNNNQQRRLPLNNTISTYGSVTSDFAYFPTRSPTVSSPASTISPNDDDESLYLLWTHQLLRERGFKPSTYRNDDQDSDNDSIDSSITDLSVEQPQTMHHHSHIHHRQQQSIPSWLSSCFPMC